MKYFIVKPNEIKITEGIGVTDWDSYLLIIIK